MQYIHTCSSSYGNRTHFGRQASGRLKQQSSSAEAERLQLRTAGPQRPENKYLGKEMRQGLGGMRRQGLGGAKGPGIGGKKIQGIGGHESHKLVAERGTDHSESKSAPKVAEISMVKYCALHCSSSLGH